MSRNVRICSCVEISSRNSLRKAIYKSRQPLAWGYSSEVECLLCMQKVPGSNPGTSNNFSLRMYFRSCGVAKLVIMLTTV